MVGPMTGLFSVNKENLQYSDMSSVRGKLEYSFQKEQRKVEIRPPGCTMNDM